MNNEVQDVLTKIYEAARNTSDNYVLCVAIGVRSDQRSEICS